MARFRKSMTGAGCEYLRPRADLTRRASAPHGRRDWSRGKERRASRSSEKRILSAAAHLAWNLKVVERSISADATARCAVDEAELHQIRLIDFFDGVGLFVDGSGDGIHAYWAAAIFFEQREHDFLVDFIQTEAVHFEQIERAVAMARLMWPLARTCA